MARNCINKTVTFHVPLYLAVLGHSPKENLDYIAVTEPSVVLPLGLIQNAAKNRFISWKTRNME